jgi:hypothetical protein
VEAGAIGAMIIGSLGIGALFIMKGFSTIEDAVGRISNAGIKIMESISNIPGGDTQLKNRVEMFASIMSALGGMVNAIGGILKGLDFGFFESEASKIDKIGKANELIATLLSGKDGKGGLQGIADSIIIGMSGSLLSLNDSQLKALPIIGDIFKSVASIAVAIAGASKGSDIKIDAAEGAVVNLTNNLPDVTKILDSLTTAAPGLVGKLIELTNTPGLADKGFKEKVDILSGLFDAFTKIVHVLSSATKDIPVPQGEGQGPIQGIAAQSRFIYNVLQILTGEKLAGMESAVSLKDIIGLVDKLEVNKSSFDKADSIAKTFENLNKISASMSGVPGSITTIANTYDVIAKQKLALNKEGIATNIEAVAEMISQTQKLDDSLSKLPEFKFPAKLEALAKGMGLGGKYAYTVQSKEVVINVTFNVTMDAQELETVMISNKKSTIRDRINFALENTTARNHPDIATAYIKSISPQSGPVASNAAP